MLSRTFITLAVSICLEAWLVALLYRYGFADRNPITAVRQSGKREKIPVLLEAAELHRLFDELEVRERAMIVCDALTGMRRSELMGLQWRDLDLSA
jgi:integrase